MATLRRRMANAWSMLHRKKGGKITLNDMLTGDTTMRYVQDVGRQMYSGHLSNQALNSKMLHATPLEHITDVHEYTMMEGSNRRLKKKMNTKFAKNGTEHIRKKMFGKGVDFEVVTDAGEKAQEEIKDYLNEVIEHNDLWRNVADLVEDAFNIGGMVMKPTIRHQVLEVEFLKAEKFWHTQYNNKMIYGGVFITQWKDVDTQYHYTKLTWYEKTNSTDWEVEKELFKSKEKQFLGEKIPFKSIFPDEEESFKLQNRKAVPFTYWKPNIKNNIVPESPLGIPIWINGIDKIKFLDTTFHRYYQEIDFGGIKRTLPSWAFDEVIDDEGKPKTRYNKEEETFMILESPPESKENIKDLTPTLRVNEFVETMKIALDLASKELGISAGTFTFDGQQIKETATGSKIRAYETHETKLNHEETLSTALNNLFISIIEMAYAEGLFNIYPEDLKFEINFVDEMFKDEEADLKRLREDAMAGNVPMWRYLVKAYEEIQTEEEAKEWVKEANEEDMVSALEGIEDAEDES